MVMVIHFDGGVRSVIALLDHCDIELDLFIPSPCQQFETLALKPLVEFIQVHTLKGLWQVTEL